MNIRKKITLQQIILEEKLSEKKWNRTMMSSTSNCQAKRCVLYANRDLCCCPNWIFISCDVDISFAQIEFLSQQLKCLNFRNVMPSIDVIL
ncbi:hypothetical protein BpHYR1_013814 [Brachionus plicatilis]|uniref:Uncharacterized protein n=1 Tax=Brachionus plicatilis TaxID=10195 RepID=A0A3M7SX68_BRAPC|nr:hypothetical protein BpHYR1_013814 [Brachionus plicatilis]